jgi:hypothetical protein
MSDQPAMGGNCALQIAAAGRLAPFSRAAFIAGTAADQPIDCEARAG